MKQIIITLVTYNKYTKEVVAVSRIAVTSKYPEIGYEDHLDSREPFVTKGFVNTDPIFLFNEKDPTQRLFIKDNSFITKYKEELK